MVAGATLYFSDYLGGEGLRRLLETIAIVTITLTGAVLAPLLIVVLIRRSDIAAFEERLRTVLSQELSRPLTLDQVEWVRLFGDADEVDLVVQGWDGWPERPEVAKGLSDFFERKGTFRLYVCHPDAHEASPIRSLMEKRLGKNPHEVISEINGTFKNINEVREQIPSKNRGVKIELIQTVRVNWYFAIYFKCRKGSQAKMRDVLLLSFYAHRHGRKAWTMPCLLLYPDTVAGIEEWFRNELAELRSGVPAADGSQT